MRTLPLLLLCCLFTFSVANAQSSRKKTYNPRKPSDNSFLKSQWWLGFRAGANLSEAKPEERFTSFSAINYDPSKLEKRYSSFSGVSAHAGVEVTFYHKGFSISLQPNYRRQSFYYKNQFEWTNPEDAGNSIELNYKQDHLLDYVEFPFFIKYDFTDGVIRPFIQVGAYYATMVSANKSVEISGTDFASGGAGPFENENIIIGAEDLFINSSMGVSGGIGVSYDLSNIRLVFDASYRHGVHNIANEKNRFSKNQLTSIGDAIDNMTIDNVSFSLGCLFPLRYLSKKYDAIN